MRRLLNAFALLVLPGALAGQTRSSGSPTAATIQFVRIADIFGGHLVEAFSAIPAADYKYRPTEAEQTVGFIAQHLENANYRLCERIGDTTHARTPKDALPDTVKALWPKDTLVARLDASLQFCDGVLERIGQLDSASRVSNMIGLETDLAEHYSQLSVYMRLLGLVPPTALPAAQPTVIELPAAALQQFVGTYQMAPGYDLIVTMRDDALSVRSTPGGAEVRLWPQSPLGFYLKEADAQLTFTRNSSGAVTGVVVHQFGRRRQATKSR